MNQRKLRVKALLIDLDGTLVDSTEAYVAAAKSGFAMIGLDRFDVKTAREIAKRFELKLPVNDLFTGIPANQSMIERFLGTYLNAYYAATLTKTKPLPNVHKTLQTLSGRFPLALITLRFISKEQVTEELRHLGFNKYFKAIVTALDVKKPKPYPDALLKGAERLGVPVDECAVVGDSIVDIHAGKSAGARTVAVLSGLFSRKELEREKPGLIIEDINWFPKFFVINR